MDQAKTIAALFDFDGVVMDTESQYSIFWNGVGKKYHPEYEEFGKMIKGQTLRQIYDRYFAGMEKEQEEITEALNRFEAQMKYEYVPGVVGFMRELHTQGVKIAIVTSSNELKMANVYAVHPELKELVDRILTAEMFTRSKPAPDCFLLGAEVFDTVPENCVVFEDSLNGLKAAKASGAAVVGLSTTLPQETVAQYSDFVIADFVGLTPASLSERLAE